MKKKAMDWNLKAAIISVILIFIIVGLSASNIGWKVEKQTVSSIKLSDIFVTKTEGEPYGTGPGTPIYTITVTNTFIPRQYELPSVSACLYNTELKKSAMVDVRWDTINQYSEFGSSMTTLEVMSGSKTAKLLAYQGIKYVPVETKAALPTKTTEEVYDQMLLFFKEDEVYFYKDCFSLQESDFKEAIVISIQK